MFSDLIETRSRPATSSRVLDYPVSVEFEDDGRGGTANTKYDSMLLKVEQIFVCHAIQRIKTHSLHAETTRRRIALSLGCNQLMEYRYGF